MRIWVLFMSGLVISDLRLERAKRRPPFQQWATQMRGEIPKWIPLDLLARCVESSKDILPFNGGFFH